MCKNSFEWLSLFHFLFSLFLFLIGVKLNLDCRKSFPLFSCNRPQTFLHPLFTLVKSKTSCWYSERRYSRGSCVTPWGLLWVTSTSWNITRIRKKRTIGADRRETSKKRVRERGVILLEGLLHFINYLIELSDS